MSWIKLLPILFLFLPLISEGATSQTATKAEADSFSLELEVNDSSYELSQKEIDSLFSVETELEYDPQYSSEIENINFCNGNGSLLCPMLFTQKQKEGIKKVSRFYSNQESLANLIEDLGRKFNRDSENAKFTMEDGRVSVFTLSKNGLAIQKEESQKILSDYLENISFKLKSDSSLELPFEETEPEVSIDSIDSMGIESLIGEGTSNFRGSTNSRIHNIKVAVSRFDGLLIKPGEEFSFVKNLGEVDGEHGYLPELVIKKDKTEPEFGGGVCQVSTTMFRAAIYAGLEITARRNHAYPVSYYNPQGMDATVYVPRPDLKFINDTPGYILIQAEIEGTQLTFKFYGTDDGRKIEVDGPKILERNSDGSMKTTFTQKVTAKNGDLIREDVFNSNYDSPNKYPHPGESTGILTEKPKDWSDNEWKKYKREHGI